MNRQVLDLSRKIECEPNEIKLVVACRNEERRLPEFFEWYRNLGVTKFFVVNNGSTDRTSDIINAQPDAYEFYTEESYSDLLGSNWLMELLNEYCLEGWTVIVDTDEFLVYPHSEEVDLHQLTAYFDQKGEVAMAGGMLGMYSKKPIRETETFAECEYFDKEFNVAYCDKFFKVNGVQYRAFGQTLYLAKVPLAKYSKNMVVTAHFLTSISTGKSIPRSKVSSVSLHYKFLKDFITRVPEEALREKHWENAALYKKAATKLGMRPNLSLYHKNHSVKYEGWEQLVRLGWMETTEEFEEYVRTLKK